MSERLREVLRLPGTTGECELGPIFEGRFGELRVRYDVEGQEGPVWTTILFRGAIAIRTTPDAAVSEYMVDAFSRICEVDQSPWLLELRTAGATECDTYGKALRHFVLYFDHAGCIEVAAKSVDLELTPAANPVTPRSRERRA